ncbi:MAG TPA: hypothetical protein VIU61_07005 [Kofleriaceae bacterium]
MTRVVIFLLPLALGCASSYQSARVLAPGKTQVTAAVSRTDIFSEDELGDGVTAWGGDVQVRQGVVDRFDFGVRLSRTPGALETLSQFSLEPKVQITGPEASTTLSVALPIGVGWAENGDDWEDGTVIITPTVFVGVELSPSAELVIAPKVFAFFPDAKTEDSEIEFGGSIGVRFHDASRTWAIQPEVSFLRFAEEGESISFLTFGVGVSAGN